VVAHQRWEGGKDPFEVDEIVDRGRFVVIVQVLAGGCVEGTGTTRRGSRRQRPKTKTTGCAPTWVARYECVVSSVPRLNEFRMR
jgi:hypothetical protein